MCGGRRTARPRSTPISGPRAACAAALEERAGAHLTVRVHDRARRAVRASCPCSWPRLAEASYCARIGVAGRPRRRGRASSHRARTIGSAELFAPLANSFPGLRLLHGGLRALREHLELVTTSRSATPNKTDLSCQLIAEQGRRDQAGCSHLRHRANKITVSTAHALEHLKQQRAQQLLRRN